MLSLNKRRNRDAAAFVTSRDRSRRATALEIDIRSAQKMTLGNVRWGKHRICHYNPGTEANRHIRHLLRCSYLGTRMHKGHHSDKCGAHGWGGYIPNGDYSVESGNQMI